MFGVFFLGALYLRRVLGYDALQIGLAFLPVDDRDGHDVDPLLRAAHHPLRRAGDCCRPVLALIAAGLALFARAPRARLLPDAMCCPRCCCSGSAPASASRR